MDADVLSEFEEKIKFFRKNFTQAWYNKNLLESLLLLLEKSIVPFILDLKEINKEFTGFQNTCKFFKFLLNSNEILEKNFQKYGWNNAWYLFKEELEELRFYNSEVKHILPQSHNCPSINLIRVVNSRGEPNGEQNINRLLIVCESLFDLAKNKYFLVYFEEYNLKFDLSQPNIFLDLRLLIENAMEEINKIKDQLYDTKDTIKENKQEIARLSNSQVKIKAKLNNIVDLLQEQKFEEIKKDIKDIVYEIVKSVPGIGSLLVGGSKTISLINKTRKLISYSAPKKME